MFRGFSIFLVTLYSSQIFSQSSINQLSPKIDYKCLTRNTKKFSQSNGFNPEGIDKNVKSNLHANIYVDQVIDNSNEEDVYLIGFCKSNYIEKTKDDNIFEPFTRIISNSDNLNCKVFYFKDVEEISAGTQESDKVYLKDRYGNEFEGTSINVRPIFILSKNIKLMNEIFREFDINSISQVEHTYKLTFRSSKNDHEYIDALKDLLIRIDRANSKIKEQAKNDSLISDLKRKNHFRIQSMLNVGIASSTLLEINNTKILNHNISTTGLQIGFIKPLLIKPEKYRIDLSGAVGIHQIKVNHEYSLDNYHSNQLQDNQGDFYFYELNSNGLRQNIELDAISNSIGMRYTHILNKRLELFAGINFRYLSKIGRGVINQEGTLNVARIYPEYSDSIRFIDVFESGTQSQSEFERLNFNGYSQSSLNLNLGLYHKFHENISWTFNMSLPISINSNLDVSGDGIIPIFMNSSHKIYNPFNLEIGLAYDFN